MDAPGPGWAGMWGPCRRLLEHYSLEVHGCLMNDYEALTGLPRCGPGAGVTPDYCPGRLAGVDDAHWQRGLLGAWHQSATELSVRQRSRQASWGWASPPRGPVPQQGALSPYSPLLPPCCLGGRLKAQTTTVRGHQAPPPQPSCGSERNPLSSLPSVLRTQVLVPREPPGPEGPSRATTPAGERFHFLIQGPF